MSNTHKKKVRETDDGGGLVIHPDDNDDVILWSVLLAVQADQSIDILNVIDSTVVVVPP